MNDIEADTLLSEDNGVMKCLTREAARAAALLKGGNGFASLLATPLPQGKGTGLGTIKPCPFTGCGIYLVTYDMM